MTQVIETPVSTPEAPIPSGQDELWYTRCAIATNFGVTVERGAFAEEFPDAGELQWRSIQASDDPDTRLIGLTWLPTPDVILALPESGIEDARDLRGKRLLVLESPESVIDVWQ